MSVNSGIVQQLSRLPASTGRHVRLLADAMRADRAAGDAAQPKAQAQWDRCCAALPNAKRWELLAIADLACALSKVEQTFTPVAQQEAAT